MANDPASVGKDLGLKPSIHRTASVRDSTFGRFCEVGARTKVAESRFGDYSYVVNDSDIIYTTVGKFCSIAAHTRINPGNHPLDRVMLSHVGYRSSAYGLGPDDPAFFDWRRESAVTLGDDVWIGHGAIVLPGVMIGHGAVIAAGAVVTKNVEAYDVVGGVPAKHIKWRFPKSIRERIITLAWWDWPHEKLGEAVADMRSLSAKDFLAKYEF